MKTSRFFVPGRSSKIVAAGFGVAALSDIGNPLLIDW
jgi:hypothetical protein